jgi:hypothetical protein
MPLHRYTFSLPHLFVVANSVSVPAMFVSSCLPHRNCVPHSVVMWHSRGSGEKGKGKSGKPLHFKNSSFHRVRYFHGGCNIS